MSDGKGKVVFTVLIGLHKLNELKVSDDLFIRGKKCKQVKRLLSEND